MDTKMYDDLLQHFLNGAKESLVNDGHVIPYLFSVFGPMENPTFVPLAITAETAFEKSLFAQYARRRLKETEAWAYVVVMDSWVLLKDDLPVNDDLPLYEKPSKHPSRREALFVTLETSNYRAAVIAPYVRHRNTVSFLKEITYPPEVCAVGPFANLLKEVSR